LIGLACFAVASPAADFAVLKPDAFAGEITRLNAMDEERVTNAIPNARAWDWLRQNIPLFECPDREVQESYYFRWWSYRKHLVHTPAGYVITEFLPPVGHAGEFNTISCALGMHLAEGRWLRDDRYLDDYTRFWLRGHQGGRQPHLHKFSSWFAAAAYDRYLVNGKQRFLTGLLGDFEADYRAWEQERRLTNGLFWQRDVSDGMEESISGSRTAQNVRPTINSYMFGNARAIAAIARQANKPRLAEEFEARAAELRRLTLAQLWDSEARFFKVRLQDNGLSDAREAIGFIPWMFHLPAENQGYEAAWAQLVDPQGFRAPFGIATAERRHPQFRSHGVGRCEWDGAVWPFATSQTLRALANVLRDYPQQVVNSRDFFDAFLTYTHCRQAGGKPYIGEYLDEVTGDWINGKNGRSRDYNHSTFADLLITGVVGLCPRPDSIVTVHPLLPAGAWNWFCLDGVSYHGHTLTVIWDKDGTRYGKGAGLRVLAEGKPIASAERLERVEGKLP
jgi:hypothetical protein